MSNNDIVSTAPVQPASTDLIDLSRLDPARRQQVAVIAQSVQASDSNTIATFGAGPQRKLSGFLDQLLAGTRADDIGVAGELVTELATDIKALNLPAVKQEVDGRPSLLASLPVVGKCYSALRHFRAMQKTVVEHLPAIERKAETHLGKLKASNAGLDRLLDATEDNLRELETWVAGGQQALIRLRDELQQERAALEGIQRLEADGGTIMSAALSLARAMFQDRPGALCQAIMLTDGQNDASDAPALAQALQDCAGVFQADCRGVGLDWSPAQLREIAGHLLGTVQLIASPAKWHEPAPTLAAPASSTAASAIPAAERNRPPRTPGWAPHPPNPRPSKPRDRAATASAPGG